MNRNPQLTPYKSIKDVQQLRRWFYDHSEGHDERPRAIQKVSAYMTRGNIPHSIEVTLLLTSSTLLDEQLTSLQRQNSGVDLTPLKLSYTMSLIKFCNGLLDPFQKSSFAMSLHKLAEILKLPSYFVEIRHIGTHEFLPSLEMLRFGAKNALRWLEENYWSEVLKQHTKQRLEDDIEEDDYMKEREQIVELGKCFKVLRKLRRDNLTKYYKFGDSSETGIRYWSAMKYVKKSNLDTLANFLICKNCLILKDELSEKKTNGIRLIYRPLLEEFGYDLVWKLFLKLLELVNLPVSDEVAEDLDLGIITNDMSALVFKNKTEVDQGVKWLEYMLSGNLKFGKNSTQEKFINMESINILISSLSGASKQYNIKLLKLLRDSHEQFCKINNVYDSLVENINTMERYYLPELATPFISKKRVPIPDTEESERPSKKLKPSEDNQMYLFDLHDAWKPIPFGTCDSEDS